MIDPSGPMQIAVHGKMMGSSPLNTAMGGTPRVYDKVIPNPQYPYIRNGDDQAVDDSNGCADAWDFYTRLNIFSRSAADPRMEVKRISSALLQALMNPDDLPAPVGLKITEARLVQSRTWFEGNDGLTAHGLVEILYKVVAA